MCHVFQKYTIKGFYVNSNQELNWVHTKRSQPMEYFRMERAQDLSQQEANWNQPKRNVVSEVTQAIMLQIQITKIIYFFGTPRMTRPGMFK